MAWEMKMTSVEVCSCASVCPCSFGPAKPDQGWCSGTTAFLVEKGHSDGVDLGGARWAFAFELPGDFLGGIDKARLYLDEALSEEQRRELQAIITGKRGGVPEGLNAAVKEWLEPRIAPISIEVGDKPSFSIGSYGSVTLERIMTEDGKQTQVIDAPIAAGFGWPVMNVGVGSGGWNDPDLRTWETLGAGNCSPITWSG
ncbi:MAG: DUF1326 domain-containing protein [Candidatus Rokuibacteriota bacterium]